MVAGRDSRLLLVVSANSMHMPSVVVRLSALVVSDAKHHKSASRQSILRSRSHPSRYSIATTTSPCHPPPSPILASPVVSSTEQDRRITYHYIFASHRAMSPFS